MQSGAIKVSPHTTDYSLVHSLVKSFGAGAVDTNGLPQSFSIYDGREIPNQNRFDTRFLPPVPPLPMGCVAETLTFQKSLKTGKTYRPDELYKAIPPGIDGLGRDVRDGMKTTIKRGYQLADGSYGDKDLAYFNCYGAGKIDDFDAARLGLYVNQAEKRGIIMVMWWQSEYQFPNGKFLPLVKQSIWNGSLHCPLGTGFESTYKDDYIEIIPWNGMEYALDGRVYMAREEYNAAMAMPWTGAFTITDAQGMSIVPIGLQAIVDHTTYYVRHLFGV